MDRLEASVAKNWAVRQQFYESIKGLDDSNAKLRDSNIPLHEDIQKLVDAIRKLIDRIPPENLR